MLTDAGILARRSSYPCCTLHSLHEAVLAWDRGDTECGDKHYEEALYLLWASRVMCDTPIETDAHPGCTSNAEATAWAAYADCLCAPCDCDTATVDCTITPNFTVLDAVAYSALPLNPEGGDTYYILSGTDVGDILTWDVLGDFNDDFNDDFFNN